MSAKDLNGHPPREVPGGSGTGVVGVLLAAGGGSRLGRGPKALLPFRGRSLVEVLADALLEGGCSSVVIVLGSGAATVLAHTDLSRHRVVINERWAEGMAGSLRCGVAEAGPCDVLVAPVDQPGITPAVVAAVIEAHRQGRVACAGYRSPDGGLRRGHPVLFDAGLAVPAAASAVGDAGARGFLAAHPELIDVVDVSGLAGPAGDADVDTPEQLHLLSED